MNFEEKNRLFIATFFKDKNESISELIEELDFKNENGLKIVPFEKIHITWKFIGDVAINKNEKIFQIVKEYSYGIKNEFLEFNKLEIWPNLKEPRMLIIKPEKYNKKFKDYFNEIDKNLYQNFEIKKERRQFSPHITIARFKRDIDINVLTDLKVKPINLQINNFHLVKSLTISNKILYESLFYESW